MRLVELKSLTNIIQVFLRQFFKNSRVDLSAYNLGIVVVGQKSVTDGSQ